MPAINIALRDVHNLLTWWSSLSMVDRRTRAIKHRIVSTVEGAALSIVTAVIVKPAEQSDKREATPKEEEQRNKE